MASEDSSSAAAARARYRARANLKVIEGDHRAILAQDREDMRCFVKNRRRQLMAALAKTEDAAELEEIRGRIANISVGPSNTVLWPRVQHIIDMLYNPKLSDEDRDFYAKRYKIFMSCDPPMSDPAQELANDRDRMHNMYKERRKTLLRQLEKERDPEKVRDLQDQIAQVRNSPVRPSNVVLWKVVQDLLAVIQDSERNPAEREHAARRYRVYMKSEIPQPETENTTTTQLSEPIARHYLKRASAEKRVEFRKLDEN